jgi:hypothetical protein
MENMKSYNEFMVTEKLHYHIENDISITENVFRLESDSFYKIFEEARYIYDNGGRLDIIDDYIFENTDIGIYDYYNGDKIMLDTPLFEAEYKGKKVDLNKPKRNSGSGKKYYVYVKDPKTGNVIIVRFGDKKGGLSAKISDPEARKRFSARHDCPNKKDKTTPGYWSCRLTKYGYLTGSNKTYPGYW